MLLHILSLKNQLEIVETYINSLKSIFPLLTYEQQIELATELLNRNNVFFVGWTPFDVQKIGSKLGYFIEIDYCKVMLESIIADHHPATGITTDVIESWIEGQTENFEIFDREIHCV